MERTYYRDEASKTFRIAQKLNEETFAVVKVFEGHTRSLKFWTGDFETTVKTWRTKRFQPSYQAKHLLDTEFNQAVQDFADAMTEIQYFV